MGINMRFATSLFIAFYIPILFERYREIFAISLNNWKVDDNSVLNYHQDLNLCQTVEAKKCLVTFSPKRIAFFSQVVMMQTYEPKLLIVGKNLKKTSVSFPVKGRNLC